MDKQVIQDQIAGLAAKPYFARTELVIATAILMFGYMTAQAADEAIDSISSIYLTLEDRADSVGVCSKLRHTNGWPCNDSRRQSVYLAHPTLPDAPLRSDVGNGANRISAVQR